MVGAQRRAGEQRARRAWPLANGLALLPDGDGVAAGDPVDVMLPRRLEPSRSAERASDARQRPRNGERRARSARGCPPGICLPHDLVVR